MGQQNLLKSKVCQDHNENQIILACFCRLCNLNRLLCSGCIKNHAAHAEKFLDQPKLYEKIHQTQANCKQLVEQLNFMFEDLTTYFKCLIQSFIDKYDISIEKANLMDNQNMNQYFSQLIQFDDQRNTLSQVIQEQCGNFKEKLNECFTTLNLQELNYIEVKKINMKKAEEFYKSGYDQFQQKNYEDFTPNLQFQKVKIYQTQFGDCLKEMGQFSESIIWYDKILILNPQNIKALSSKGDSLRIKRNFTDAISIFNTALSIDQNNPNILSLKGQTLKQFQGQCLLEMGKLQEAEDCLKKSILLQPNSEINKSYLQRIQQERKQ